MNRSLQECNVPWRLKSCRMKLIESHENEKLQTAITIGVGLQRVSLHVTQRGRPGCERFVAVIGVANTRGRLVILRRLACPPLRAPASLCEVMPACGRHHDGMDMGFCMCSVSTSYHSGDVLGRLAFMMGLLLKLCA